MEQDWDGMILFGKTFGIEWLAIVMLIILMFAIVAAFSKALKGNADRMSELAAAIGLLTDKVSEPHLNTDQSVMVFRAVMDTHILRKLRYLGDILDVNSIQDRRDQIKLNIDREFRKITAYETEKLSAIKSSAGDMGKIVNDNLDWSSFIKAVYAIFFSNDKDKHKIRDIRLLMEAEVDRLVERIKANGFCND